jgi:TolB-like protein/Flp pilus assembly protein TadD
MIFTIGDCSIDTAAYEMRRNGERVAVEPQVFDLLVLLLENGDRLVTKDEITRRIWNGRIVSEAALSSRIKTIRQVIGDDGKTQTMIRTVRGRGFRVVAEIGRSGADGEISSLAAAALMPKGPGIAVLRFSNLNHDPALEFFGKALAEEIITNLTRFSELRVAARALSAEFDGSDDDAAAIGKQLAVDYLIQGALRRAGERVRVSAQLLETNGTVVWAETYDREQTPADIFAVEEDIAGHVVGSIASITSGVIAREALDRGRGKPPADLNAYESIVRTNEMMMSGFTADSHRAARDQLEAVVKSEPDYATAWAMLAWATTFEYTEGYNQRPGRDPLEAALAAARRAVELAPANPMAHFAMARVHFLMREMEQFRTEAANALQLNPHEPFLLGNIGCWLCFSGSWDEGVPMIRKAIALNAKVYPRWWHVGIAKNHIRKGEFREALAEFKIMNLPNWWWNQLELAFTYAKLGEQENAENAAARLLELYPGFDIEKARTEYQKFNFEQSFIDLVIEGLRLAGVPERAEASQHRP